MDTYTTEVTKQMKAGNKVKVFSHPIDQRRPEGQATLVKAGAGYPFQVDDTIFEYWQVRFDDEPELLYQRCVSKRDIV